MDTTLVLWTYDPAVTATDAIRADHVEYLRTKLASGELLAAGRRTDVPGGVLVYRAADADALAQLLADDPFTPAGIIAETELIGWNASLGLLSAGVE